MEKELEKYPNLLKEWDHKKNKDIKHNRKQFWWICEQGHEWQASILTRKKGHGCPYCSGLKAIIGENDVATLYPNLVEEFHPTKNGSVRLDALKESSGKKVWWRCKHGHEWEAQICSRTKMKTGCPYCAGRKAIRGENDFLTLHPELSSEWDYNKNSIDPQEIKSGSQKKYWWKCARGHEWEASVNNRVRGQGCPYCVNKKVLAGYNDLESNYPDIAKQWDDELNYPLKPSQVTCKSQKMVWWKCNNGHSFKTAICHRTKDGVICPYCSGKRAIKGESDFASQWPELLSLWDYERNDSIGLKPDEIGQYSTREIYCLCDKGHRWKTSLRHITKDKSRCPYCAGQKAIHDKNDLATVNPEWLRMWDYSANKKQPRDYMLFSHAAAFFRCDKGHVFKREISKMNESDVCPVCIGKKILSGYNDFATIHPELMNEWCSEKNQGIEPKTISRNSGLKVWWECNQGHRWRATVDSRSRGRNCPICSRK